MADQNTSLPIHSITEGNSVKISKDLNTNAIDNVVFVNLSDETNALVINDDGSINIGNTITVTVDKTKIWDGTDTLDIVVINSAYGATPSVIPIAGKYEETPTAYDDGDAVPLLTDENGRLIVIATLDPSYDYQDDSAFTVATDFVAAIGALADETTPDSVNEGDIGIPRMTLDRKLLVRIVGANDGYRWDIDSSGNGKIDIAAQSLTAVKISKDANANSELNPIYVYTVKHVSGTEVHNYNTQANVAGGGTNNHVYPVSSGKTLLLTKIICSASGAGKWEVQVGPVATLASMAVQFTSTAQPNCVFDFDPAVEIIEAAGTEQVRVIRKNREGQAQDVYSVIMGSEV
jgi:hypothetical protein